MQCTVQQIRKWRDRLAAQSRLEGHSEFMGRPEAWYQDLHWFCPNGHVSGVYLAGEAQDKCMACGEQVLMGPPVGEVEFAALMPCIREL